VGERTTSYAVRYCRPFKGACLSNRALAASGRGAAASGAACSGGVAPPAAEVSAWSVRNDVRI
jgi:hypothetical protein